MDINVTEGVHGYTGPDGYVPPRDAQVAEHLSWFCGLKLGLMMHWSPATQLGVLESWPLCDGEGEWSQVEIDWTDDMDAFREQYWALNKSFNPVRFAPGAIARTAKECGFRYILFTTKHHDGFCMFDTAETDYKVTARDCPFSTDSRADIARAMFDAARAQGLAVSAYFSKPDWHSDFYWRREFGVGKTRNVNYDVRERPELWESFVRFTHRQLLELTSNYGKIDALWLDGGWVRPGNLGQDIRLGEVVDRIRSTTQPHLIVCDRTVGGPYENIVTPEQEIPGAPLGIPWEACISMGGYFSFHYDDKYKTAQELVHTLLDVASKGGSLALNVTLRPDGAIPGQALALMSQLGQWLEAHGEGIYGSSACAGIEPHGNVVYTHAGGATHVGGATHAGGATQAGGATYAYVLYGDTPRLPKLLDLRSAGPAKSVRLLRTGAEAPFKQEGGLLHVDASRVPMSDARFADCFAIEH